MSVGGALSAAELAALAKNGTSVAMRWIDMFIPGGDSHEAPVAGTEQPPVPENQAYTLKVVEEPTNEFVRLIKDPFNLISVMGPARSGKSTLMNILAGCKKTELFPTSPGSVTYTKGIYVPTRILTLPEFSALEGEPVVEAGDSNIKVSFVDTEGQGAVGANYDMNLFSPALITSRAVIYNRTGGLLVEEILSQLAMMTQAAQRLTPENKSDEKQTKPLFGHLFIIFNQFRTTAKDTSEFLFSKLMTDEKAIDRASVNRNNIRALLRTSFESIQVFILPDRLKQEARDALSDGSKPFILLEDFDAKYQDYFKLLRTSLSKALIQPRELSAGLPLTGGSIADFMPSFADAINKSEPLNVPSIFESAQNDSINKGLTAFTAGLTLYIDGLMKEEAKPTQILSNVVDRDITLLQAQLSSTLSYMSPSVVKGAQDDASKSAQPMKESLLDANLNRLKGLMSSALTTAIAAIDSEVKTRFPETKLLLSNDDIQNQFKSISTSIIDGYKTKGESYDARTLPEGYVKTLQDALDSQKTTVSNKVTSAWSVWALDQNQTMLRSFTEALTDLATKTRVGDSKSYTSNSSVLLQRAQMDFEKKLVTEYKGIDKEGQKKNFATAADNVSKTQQAIWEQNDAEVKKQTEQQLENLKGIYTIQLQESLQPFVEPSAYDLIVTSSAVRAQLTTFCERNNVSDAITRDVTFKFDSFVSSEKGTFKNTYNKACADYGLYIQGEFNRGLPLILADYNAALDAINLTLESSANSKLMVERQCEGKKVEALTQATLLQQRLNTKPNGIVSISIVATFQSALNDGLKLGMTSKIAKYDEVVSGYNKALLTATVVPVIDTALANKFVSEEALKTDIDRAQASFMARARGDDSDKKTKWDEFYSRTYQALVETVRRNNAYKVPGLEGTSAATKDIQLHVIKNIWRDCADMANALKMSYINSSMFSDDGVQEVASSNPDPNKPNPQTTRTFRLNNQFSDTKQYMWEKKTNLEFFDWVVETTDVMFGKPIITDLKPSKLDTVEYGAQPTPITVTIGNSSTETNTITDSKTWGISGGVEAGFKWGGKVAAAGAETSWEANVKATFNAKFDSTHSDQLTTTYTTSTSAQIILPPNRINCVNQMVFNQRTSLPYTAKVRVVPRLRFQNGFTAWGGGGSYRTNERTGALKDQFRKGDRNFDIEQYPFTRCDEIRDAARGDSDPWMWKLAMSRQSWLVDILNNLADAKPYEVYVKGKWEGITGKYAVTTVTPKSTNLTLMPLDI